MAAYNPNGRRAAGAAGRDEGYLYWVGWLGHNGNSVFQRRDGNGFYRRIYLTGELRPARSTSSRSARPPASSRSPASTSCSPAARARLCDHDGT